MTDPALREPDADFESPYPLAADRRLATERILPTRTNRTAAAASNAIGGPVGLHAAIGRSRRWTPLRVVLLVALAVLACSWFGKAGCLQQTTTEDGVVQLNWDNQRQFYELCYTDIVATYGTSHLTVQDLQHGAMPYRTYWTTTENGEQVRHYLDQPVLIGYAMYAVAKATQGYQALVSKVSFLPKQLDVVVFFNIAALLLAIYWLLAIWATMISDRRRIWIGMLMAISPLVLVHAFTAWEMIPVALVALAMLSFTREKIILTGVFLGLAASAALYPLLLIPALLVLCLRRQRLGDFAAMVVTGLIVWAALNLPVLLAYARGWSQSYRNWWNLPTEPDSLYSLIIRISPWAPSTQLVNIVSLVLIAAVIGGVVYLGLRTRRSPNLAQLMFLLVAGFLLVSKDPSPQNSLWLVPLAVLAIPHPRVVMAWMAVDALVWVPRMGLFLDPDRHWLPDEWFYLAILMRALILIGLCIYVIRRMLRAPTPGHPPRQRVNPGPAVSLPPAPASQPALPTQP